MDGTFRVRTARWPDDAATLQAIRREVFVEEQQVPQDIEWDGRDGECLHALAVTAAGEPIGCGRLLPDGHIGRLAVRRAWRGRGVGAALLQHLVGLARGAGHARVVLNAQTHAAGFYRRYGFLPIGEEFMEAGIAHQAMEAVIATR
jgi:predicted GNAT family N-acyltransferase